MSKYQIMKLLGAQYTHELMEALTKKDMRFKDMQKVVPNDKTLSLRIKDLMRNRLIKTESKIVDSRPVILYKLTLNGKKILKLAEEINSLAKN